MTHVSESKVASHIPSRDSIVPLIAIVGPTASGKSALAVSLAERFGAEILACDSTQVYRGFDIGTAKPTVEERRRVPHHLIDLIDASAASTAPFTAGEYRRRAVDALAALRARGRLPIFTVGTGLYLRALLDGLADAPRAFRRVARALECKQCPTWRHLSTCHVAAS